MPLVKLNQSLNPMPDKLSRDTLRSILTRVYNALSTQTCTSAALRIKGGSASPTVQTNAAWQGIINGIPVTKATAQDLPALSGSVTAGTFGLWVHAIDVAGTLYTIPGTIAAASQSALRFPEIPDGYAVIGYTIVTISSGTFTAGTTNLDAANVTATFVNTVGAFDPNATL